VDEELDKLAKALNDAEEEYAEALRAFHAAQTELNTAGDAWAMVWFEVQEKSRGSNMPDVGANPTGSTGEDEEK
jgi:hypothetical protein